MEFCGRRRKLEKGYLMEQGIQDVKRMLPLGQSVMLSGNLLYASVSNSSKNVKPSGVCGIFK